MAWILLQVAVGGALGSVCRYLTGSLAIRFFGSAFPYGTLLANSIGCLAMGFAFVLLVGDNAETAKSSPLLMTGFLGGYTTMSAFSLDSWNLLNSGRITEAFLYIGGTLLLAYGCLIAGLYIGRWLGL